MRTLIPTASAALLVLLGGCDSDPAGTEVHETYLRALAVDETESSIIHEGGARYGTGTMSETHRKLEISSFDPAANSRVYLQILSSAPPVIGGSTGIFPLEPRNFMRGDNEGNTALYLRDGELYIAEEGTLTVTEASGSVIEGRMEGEFEFTAVYWCTPSADSGLCQLPTNFSASAKRIQVEGDFVAMPHGPVLPLCERCE